MFKCVNCGKDSPCDHTCIHCHERMQCASYRRVGDYVYRCNQDAYHGDHCTHFSGADVEYAPVYT